MANPEFQHLITIAQSDMRAVNRSMVLEYLRLCGSASRTELAAQLRLSKPTVMRIVDELLASQLIYALREHEKGARRSREMLSINKQHNLVIAIDLGGSHISGAIITIGGEILYQNRLNTDWGAAEANFEVLLKFLLSLRKRAARFTAKILGIAVGVPGIIDPENGDVKLAPGLNWDEFPLLSKLSPHFELPILIENDVNLAALGENWFGAGVGIKDLINLSIGTGIGAGIILNGKLYRGYRQSSGEVGYMLPGIDYLNRQYPGFGALESLASCKAIGEQAMQHYRETGGDPNLFETDAAAVFKAARAGEAWALAIVTEIIDYLSLAIVNLSVCFDPEFIIINGGIASSADMLIPPIQQRLKGVIPFVPRIEASTLRNNAPLLGCVVHVFQKVADYRMVQMA